MAPDSKGADSASVPAKAPTHVGVAARAYFGAMYGQWAMDRVVVETAIAVAQDFVNRPSYFTQIPDDLASVLADLWYRTGSDPRFPDRVKRATIFGTVFGPCDCAWNGNSSAPTQFQAARDAVLEAAVRYTQRTFDEGRLSLLRAFRDRLITLREYLTTSDGSSFRRSYTEVSSMFAACVLVLTNSEIARAYGLPPAPSRPAWPLLGDYSGQGAQLIEAISDKTTPADKDRLTRHQVLAAQRVAFDGARSVDAAMSGNLEDNDALDRVIIPTAFTWWSALRDLAPALPRTEEPAQADSRPLVAEKPVVRTTIRPLR